MKLGGSDLIRIVCHQCGEQEVCPSTLVEMDESGSRESRATDSDFKLTKDSTL